MYSKPLAVLEVGIPDLCNTYLSAIVTTWWASYLHETFY